MAEFVERREYFRINVDCEINYRLVNSDEIYKARCTTLSGAGISFVTRQALQPEEDLEIIIQSQLPSTPPLRANVKVISVRALEDQTFIASASMTVLQDD